MKTPFYCYIIESLTNTMEGLYLTSKDVNTIINYLNFATRKQKIDINNILRKPNLSKAEYKRLKSYLFKYKMYMQSNSNNVDARLNKIKRTPLTIPNNKHI